jgi:carboxylesterase
VKPEIRPFADPEHEPFTWGVGPRRALLLHGFPGTPAEMRPLGSRLVERGWRVHAPLLPGFGPEIPHLSNFGREDWLEAAAEAWSGLMTNGTRRVVVGYSMGASLALHLAAHHHHDRLVLLAPFWRLPGLLGKVIPILKWIRPRWHPFEKADLDSPEVRENIRSFLPGVDLDDLETRRFLQEDVSVSTHTIDEVLRLGAEAGRLAREVHTPVLLLQGRDDPIVRRKATLDLADRLGSTQVVTDELPAAHDLIQNPDRPWVIEAIERTADFLEGGS